MSVRLVVRVGREVGTVNQGHGLWRQSQVLRAGCRMVKERHCPGTPGASDPAGKTAVEEVTGRGLGCASERNRAL